jgi:sucrose-6-phosphate hydrolase SacC (GH32 family)
MVKPYDLLNPTKPRTSSEIQKERMAICEECPELFQLTKQCKECMCIMPLKTKLAEAECPLGKWKASV